MIRNNYHILIFVGIAAVAQLNATVTVYNFSDKTIYAGVYYYASHGKAALQTPVVKVVPGGSQQLQEPVISLTKDRYLVFDDTWAEVKKELSYSEFTQSVGSVRARFPGDYFIASKDGRLKGYTWTEWRVKKAAIDLIKQATGMVQAPVLAQIKKDQVAIQKNAYKDTPVTVRVSNTLSPQEQAYHRTRLPKVKRALERLLGRSLDDKKIPEIALVCSGGGYRAMLYTSGFLTAAQEEGLFDAFMYQAVLSGSSWAVAYLTQEYARRNRSIKDSSDALIDKVTKSLGDLSAQEIRLLADALLVKVAFKQPLSTIDLFGLLLGNRLFDDFGNERHRIYLSYQLPVIERAEWPLPIYTAVPAETTRLEKLIYEFTPIEVRAPWGMSVPPYAFGDKFASGIRQKDDGMFAPEQPLGILMGTFGSAYAFTLKRAYQEIEKKMPAILQPLIKNLPKEVGQTRIAAADFFNFTAGITGSAIKNNRIMLLADAGLGISNLPFQPVSGDHERKADVYILVDISATTNSGNELKKIEDYMRSKGRKFPQINYQDIDKKNINVFTGSDPDMPTVIYMPRYKEQTVWDMHKDKPTFSRYKPFLEDFDIDTCVAQEGCGSFNLQYPRHMALQVQKLGEFNLRAAMAAIKQAINMVIDRQSQTASTLQNKPTSIENPQLLGPDLGVPPMP